MHPITQRPLLVDLKGRTSLVTGAGGAIGTAIARALASSGASVALNDISASGLKPLEEELREMHGAKVVSVCGSVASENDVRQIFSHLDREWGGVDILINNAGLSYDEDIFNTTLERWNEIIGVHLTGTFLCAREAMLRMRDRGWGRIIQISSVSAHQGAVKGFIHYSSAKAGQLGFTKTLARTAAPYGVTVNAIAPGIVDTPMFRATHGDPTTAPVVANVPLGISSPEDVAASVQFLCSDGARHITGSVLDVNGGLYYR